jgi:hypothetical protein
MILENLYTSLMRSAQRSKQRLETFNPFFYYRQGTKGKAILALVAVCLFWGLTWVISSTRRDPAIRGGCDLRELLYHTRRTIAPWQAMAPHPHPEFPEFHDE